MSGKQDKSLYFVALVPPEPFFSEVQKIKHELSSNYRTKASLKSPPHITLHMPFSYPESAEDRIFSALHRVHFGKFPIVQNGFGAFAPRVIYIRVESSSQLSTLHESVMKSIRSELKIAKDSYRNEGFKPHMTVAFRDLRPAMFKQAWEAMKDAHVSCTWEACSFFLLKHNGKEWGLLKEFGDSLIE
ncbi:MAG: 2'-5' RNA ligase family protein [Cyclobacteriaceae bacterium]